MAAPELTLVDTNVLIYAVDALSPFHSECRAILDRAHWKTANLCVAPQSLAEFYAVVTNPRRVRTPADSAAAIAVIESITALPGIWVLPVPVDLVTRWLALCRQLQVTGARIFDLQLAAVMVANGVHKIYTLDVGHFGNIPGIAAQKPEAN